MMGTRIRRLLTVAALLGACLLLALPVSAEGELQTAEDLAAEELAADLAAVLDQPAIGPAEATPVPAPPAPAAEPVGETLDEGLDVVEDVPAPSPVQEVIADVTRELRTVTGTPDDDGRPNPPGGPESDPGDGTSPTPVRQAGSTTTRADAGVQVLALDALRAPVGATSLRGFRTDARRAVIATVTADDALVPLAATAPPTARTTIEPIGGQVPQLPSRIGVEGLVAAALLVLATAGLLAELGPRRSA